MAADFNKVDLPTNEITLAFTLKDVIELVHNAREGLGLRSANEQGKTQIIAFIVPCFSSNSSLTYLFICILTF